MFSGCGDVAVVHVQMLDEKLGGGGGMCGSACIRALSPGLSQAVATPTLHPLGMAIF